ncbi:MAG: ATP-binding protein [Succinivibrio sp.]|nr:ATP-binding protein [Succinivibrio sp.]
MEYPRTEYLQKLIAKIGNGRVKIVTGLRRCGKTYLLFELFTRYLHSAGVRDEQIIALSLEEIANARYRNPLTLDAYIRERMTEKSAHFYILLDEIQFVAQIKNPFVDDPDNRLSFVDVLLGLIKLKNVDVYVTGSNSRMLSSDVLTQFRDRADEIRVYPLSFAEFYQAYEGERSYAWDDYCTYGGMPGVVTLSTHEEKSAQLRSLFTLTYLKDVLERHRVQNHNEIIEELINAVASSVGSLTNPTRLSHTFWSERQLSINSTTLERYLEFFIEAYLLHKARRFDVKGKKYLSSPLKYYFTDVGLRNARLGFRQQEESHLMENVLYCDLLRRGCDVDVGVVEQNGKDSAGRSFRKQLEVDFVVNRADSRCYIQCALSVAEPQKREQELASLRRIPDSFKKIVVVKDHQRPRQDEQGISYVGIESFLLSDELF